MYVCAMCVCGVQGSKGTKGPAGPPGVAVSVNIHYVIYSSEPLFYPQGKAGRQGEKGLPGIIGIRVSVG